MDGPARMLVLGLGSGCAVLARGGFVQCVGYSGTAGISWQLLAQDSGMLSLVPVFGCIYLSLPLGDGWGLVWAADT